MVNHFKKILGVHGDLAFAVFLIGILLVLFTPIPSQMLDFLLLTNFCLALLILLLTFYTSKPVEFSTFPSILLIITLFRLSLNIAATRLILGGADAGRVINAIGSYAVAGNYVIGLIVFIILIVVQYVVVTNGAQRVAEVSARFTLDSMPGQQMSIDADLNMGFIDQQEAQQRRRAIQKEANFYGSMDGASKFVKGDAIAGIIILLVDIIGGLIIGVTQQSMSWGDALQTYALLTVGDGIVTQVPALIVSVASGIIVTRSDSDGLLAKEVFHQLTAFPKTLFFISGLLFLFLFIPGIPAVPVFCLLAILLGVSYFSYHHRSESDQTPDDTEESPSADAESYESLLKVEPLEVRVGQSLALTLHEANEDLLDNIATFRKQFALTTGLIIPKLKIKADAQLEENSYEIAIHGLNCGSGKILSDHILAIHNAKSPPKIEGIPTRDPAYGLSAVWIKTAEREKAVKQGYTLVEPITVFYTHLVEIIRQQKANLLTRAQTEALLARIRTSNPSLVEEIVPTMLTVSEVQKIFQSLLTEGVSIRHTELILEAAIEAGHQKKDLDYMVEKIRQKLGPVICQSFLTPQNELYVLTFDHQVEKTIGENLKTFDHQTLLALDPETTENLLIGMATQVEKMAQNNLLPVLVCAPELRRHIRRLTERIIPHLAILSTMEIPNHLTIRTAGTVSFAKAEKPA